MTIADIHGNLHKGAGAPEGGQFAGKVNSQPESTLTRKEAREAHTVLLATARAQIRSFRIDPTNADDVAQDAWVDLLKRKNRKNPETGEMEAVNPRDLFRDQGLLRLVPRTIANRDYTLGGQQGFRHEDFRARRALHEQEATFEAEHGRKMTPAERVEAADAIRLSFAAGRRPREDFHVEYKGLSLDATPEDGGSIADTLVADELQAFDDQEDAAAYALHEVENGMAAKTDVRRDVWRIVTIRSGAPQVRPQSVSSKDATRHRKLVAEAGGARVLARKWLDGLTTAEEDASLFAPFGDLDVDSREATASVLEDHPSFADQLWGEALRAASRR